MTSNSIVLHFPVSDHVNTTYSVEVNGQQWAVTRRSFYIVSGLAGDRAHRIAVSVIQNGQLVGKLRQTVYTREFSEQCSFHSRIASMQHILYLC